MKLPNVTSSCCEIQVFACRPSSHGTPPSEPRTPLPRGGRGVSFFFHPAGNYINAYHTHTHTASIRLYWPVSFFFKGRSHPLRGVCAMGSREGGGALSTLWGLRFWVAVLTSTPQCQRRWGLETWRVSREVCLDRQAPGPNQPPPQGCSRPAGP